MANRTHIHNNQPRLDVTGHPVNSHEGGVYNFNGTWFMYGTVYENCTQGPTCTHPCGYNPNTFSVYTSPDLVEWTLRSTNILPEMSIDNNRTYYWMPNVGYNRHTNKYIMQYVDHACGHSYSRKVSCAPIAVADSPLGPFRKVAPLELHGGQPGTTLGLFVDRDGSAYVKYNTRHGNVNGSTHVVEQLSEDWLTTTGKFSIVAHLRYYEGGGMFRRGELVYYMAGTGCCFCQWGGSARVWVSAHPLGPWTLQVADANKCQGGGNPAPHPPAVNPCAPNASEPAEGPSFTVPAQQFNVIDVTLANGSTAILYYGERSNYPRNGLKSEQWQAWVPLEFDAAGVVQPMTFPARFTLDLPHPPGGHVPNEENTSIDPSGITSWARVGHDANQPLSSWSCDTIMTNAPVLRWNSSVLASDSNAPIFSFRINVTDDANDVTTDGAGHDAHHAEDKAFRYSEEVTQQTSAFWTGLAGDGRARCRVCVRCG